MSPLRFIGSIIVGRLSSRRICGQALGSTRLLHQSRTVASVVGGPGFPGRFPMGELHRSVVMAGALSLLGGGIWYLKENPEEPAARKRIHQEIVWEEDTFEDKAMKKRFEEWMIKYDRTYKDKEEKAMRYELFKCSAQRVDRNNASESGCTFATNQFSDRTREERRSYC